MNLPPTASATDPGPDKVESNTASESHQNGRTDAWSVEESKRLYGIKRWGAGYLDIAANGKLTVKAPGSVDRPVELIDMVDGLRQRGLEMPVMLRIEDLLSDRVTRLNETFRSAIQQYQYQGQFRGVFPIKVNQQNHVVGEIARLGEQFGHGFEAGSKAELLIAMSLLKTRDSLLICNGYKDQEFVDLGLQAARLGFKCFFVIETPVELELILQRSEYWHVKPLLGVRLKLSTGVDGHWAGDSGDRSLFGLSPRQLIEVVDELRDEKLLDRLQLVHFHLGSQIPNIRNVRDGVAEACRYYVDLVREGAALSYLDLGGGLAVDYDGSGSTDIHSRNYDLNEYCIDVVETVMASLDPSAITHPTLITESGRWTVAPTSMLLFNVLSATDFNPTPIPKTLPPDLNEWTLSLVETLSVIKERRLQENYNDAVYYRDQMRSEFRSGRINLRERAFAENVCLTILKKIAEMASGQKRLSPELEKLRDSLSDIYYGNFSVFQSLPDAWAIEQIFPVMPIHRLHEQPTRNAIIADLTCDCDGKLSRFAGVDGPAPTLPLHPLRANEDYLIGVFLIGGYQETLGDLHNLFGDTNVASVRIDDEGNVEFLHELKGDSISDVLSYVEYHPGEMLERFRSTAETAVRAGTISVAERQQMLQLFGESLRGYTYFEQ